VPDHTQILFGVAVDAKLGESVSVTLISSLGKEDLQAYTQAHAAPVLQAAPVMKKEPVVKVAPVVEAAPVREPEVEATEVQEVPETKVAPAVVAKVEPMDLFAATAMQAVEVAAKTVFDGVKTETVAKPQEVATKAVAEIPDEVHFAAETVEEPMPMEEVEAVEESPFRVESELERAPEVLEPMAETAAVTLPERSSVEEMMSEKVPVEEVVAKASSPAAVRRPESLLTSVMGGNRPAKEKDQDMFQAEDEGRGRFKNTEPSLVQGEDLDVPTWMRLRKKLQR
jgi:cell division protein FtsZ